jgi:hypothetical protein
MMLDPEDVDDLEPILQVRYRFEDGTLLDPGVQQFWTEHSDRATVPTWAKFMGVSKEDRDYLGRWKPSESDEYVRNARATTMRIQESISKSIRDHPNKDVVGDHGTLQLLAEWMRSKEVSEPVIKLQMQRLRWFKGQVVDEQLNEADFDSGKEEEVEEVGKGQFVVSLERGKRPQTLHCVGKCWRKPGLHFRDYIVLDKEEVLNPDIRYMPAFDKVCRDCYPTGEVDKEENEEEADTSSSSE